MAPRKMFACRLPLQALADLDRLTALLAARQVSGRVSQADAVAWALARAVAELDAGEPERPPQPALAPAPAAARPPGVIRAPAPAERRVAARGGALAAELELRAEVEGTSPSAARRTGWPARPSCEA